MKEFDLNIGAQMFCADGKCGKLAKFAVNTDAWQVTHLIVEEGLLLKRARVFPIHSIERATPDEIHLAFKADELVNYPEYREEVIEKLAPMHVGSSRPTFPVDQGGTPYAHSTAPPVHKVFQRVRFGVPEDLAVVEQGTPIIGLDGQIGKLDHFLVDAADGRITRLVAQQGILFTTKRTIPVSMAEFISEKGVSIAVTDEELKGLPQYKPQGDGQQEAT